MERRTIILKVFNSTIFVILLQMHIFRKDWIIML